MTCATVFNALRWLVRTGSHWRMMPHDLPPWPAVYQQMRCWLNAGVSDDLVADLRVVLRVAAGRTPEPSAAMFDARTLHSTPESGARAGDDEAKKRTGSKIHLAVDTVGNLLAMAVTPANEQERAQVGTLAAAVHEATGQSVEVAFVDQGDTGVAPAHAAAEHSIRLEVIKLPEAKRGIGWMARFRRLARDYEHLTETLSGYHYCRSTVCADRIAAALFTVRFSIILPQKLNAGIQSMLTQPWERI